MKEHWAVPVIFSIVMFSVLIVPINAEIQGNIPKLDDNIIIVQHDAIKYPRFVNDAFFMSQGQAGFPFKGNEP